MLKHISYEEGQNPDEFHLGKNEIFYNAIDGILYFGGLHHETLKFEGGGGGSHFTIKGSSPHATIMAMGVSAAGDTYIATDSGTGWHKGDGFISAGGTGPANWQNIGTLVGPQGQKGDQGLRGLTGIQGYRGYGYNAAEIRADNHLWVTPIDDQGVNQAPVDLGSVQGVQGPIGPEGPAGPDAYSVWEALPTNTGKTFAEFIASLKGATGAIGEGYGHIHVNGAGELLVTPTHAAGAGVEINLGTITGKQGIQGIQGIKGNTGTGIHVKGAVTTSADLPTTGNIEGDAHLVTSSGDLYIWTDAGVWEDTGHIAGATGLQGGQGVQGITGARGAQGNVGADGPQGLKGDKGDAGTHGTHGADGADGADGLKGDKGDTGNDGSQGLKGDKGDQGDAGVDGTGVTIKGSATRDDIYLKSGTAGDMWIITSTGADHGHGLVSNGTGAGQAHWTDVGAIQGPIGEKGIQGVDGAIGADGIGMMLRGHSSEAAIRTKTGVAGDIWIVVGGTLDGYALTWNPITTSWDDAGRFKGDKGDQGVSGPKGDKGDIGPKGLEGLSGGEGAQGLQGIQGIDGLQGVQGIVGPQGTGLEIKSVKDDIGLIRAITNPEIGEIHLANDTGDMWIWENPTPPHDPANADWNKIGHVRGPTGPAGQDGTNGVDGLEGVTRIQEAVATINDLPHTGNTEFDLRHVEDACKDYVWNGYNWAYAGDIVGPRGDGIYMQGEKTIAEINAMVTLNKQQGYLYIMSQTGRINDHHLAVTAGDGLKWSSGRWVNVGQLRGPIGPEGKPATPYASQAEVNAGTIDNKAISPKTLKGANAHRAGVGFDFYGATAPSGALSCDGQEVSKTTYALLYKAIGNLWATTKGANAPASGNFRLPPQNELYARGKGGTVGAFVAESNKAHHHSTVTHHHTTAKHRHSANHDHNGRADPYITNVKTSKINSNSGTADANVGHWSPWKYTGGNSGTQYSLAVYGNNNVHIDSKNFNTGEGGGANTGNTAPSTNNEGGEARPNSIVVLKCIWTGL